MTEPERQLMNYRRGDDLILGADASPPKIPSSIELIVRPEGWKRTKGEMGTPLRVRKRTFKMPKQVREKRGKGEPLVLVKDLDRYMDRRKSDVEYHNIGRELRFGRCNVSVLRASELTIDQAVSLLDIEYVDYPRLEKLQRVEADISYPLKHVVTARFGPYHFESSQRPSGGYRGYNMMVEGYILWQICRAYRRIYEEEAEDGRHGVWGHCLHDLALERVQPHTTGWCSLAVGS